MVAQNRKIIILLSMTIIRDELYLQIILLYCQLLSTTKNKQFKSIGKIELLMMKYNIFQREPAICNYKQNWLSVSILPKIVKTTLRYSISWTNNKFFSYTRSCVIQAISCCDTLLGDKCYFNTRFAFIWRMK